MAAWVSNAGLYCFAQLKMRILCFLISVLFLSSFAMAQSRPEDGGREIELWAGGGSFWLRFASAAPLAAMAHCTTLCGS